MKQLHNSNEPRSLSNFDIATVSADCTNAAGAADNATYNKMSEDITFFRRIVIPNRLQAALRQFLEIHP